jgi:hypothetical protein
MGKPQGHEPNCSPPSNAKVKNGGAVLPPFDAFPWRYQLKLRANLMFTNCAVEFSNMI